MPVTEWKRYDLGLPSVNEADLDALEAARGLPLPPDFRQTMTAHAGDRPRPNITTIGRGGVGVDELFVVKADRSGRDAYNVWHFIEAFEANLPGDTAARLIPFTSNGGQAILALDYRAGTVPQVSLVDLDIADEPDAITVVAPDFATWLNQLHD